MRCSGTLAKYDQAEPWPRVVGAGRSIVDALPGAHTQAASLDELFRNLSEVIRLVTGNDSAPENLPEERLSTREN